VADGTLADGWGVDEPAQDTLLRAGAASLAARIAHMASAAGRPLVDDGRWVAASLADTGMFSTAGVLTRPVHDWRWVPPALAALAPAGVPRVLLSPFPTPDLSGDGPVLVGHPPFMVRPPGGDGPAPVPGLEIRRITDASDLRAFEATMVEAFPVPDMDPAAAPTLFRPGYLGGASHAYLGLLEGVPVATSAAHVAAGVNHVEFVSTLSTARGRGIGAAMTWAAAVSAPELPAVLIASDDGRGVYESLGFLPVCRWTLWMAT
jgi:hypothetical protein